MEWANCLCRAIWRLGEVFRFCFLPHLTDRCMRTASSGAPTAVQAQCRPTSKAPTRVNEKTSAMGDTHEVCPQNTPRHGTARTGLFCRQLGILSELADTRLHTLDAAASSRQYQKTLKPPDAGGKRTNYTPAFGSHVEHSQLPLRHQTLALPSQRT